MALSESTCKLFKWRIDQFSVNASLDDPQTQLNSPTFELSGGAQFYLRFFPTCWKSEWKSYSSFCLTPTNLGGTNSIALKFRSWAENNIGEKLGEPTERNISALQQTFF
jgi:hypothetical protein